MVVAYIHYIYDFNVQEAQLCGFRGRWAGSESLRDDGIAIAV